MCFNHQVLFACCRLLNGLAEGIPCNEGAIDHCLLWQAELRGIQRCMRYCRILRERQAAAQAAVLQTMGIEAKDIYVQVQSMPIVPLHMVLMDQLSESAGRPRVSMQGPHWNCNCI